MAEEEEGEVARSRDCSRLRAVRISLADPVSYTLPYDRSLAQALARRGHDVDLFAASFVFAELPPPDGYRQHDVFFTRSARLLRGNPRSRLRFLSKGLEYVPSARRMTREIARLDPDVLHVQWLGLPRYDLRWLEAVRRAAAGRLHRARRPAATDCGEGRPLAARVQHGRSGGRARRRRRRSAGRARRRPRAHRAHPASGLRALAARSRRRSGRRSSSSGSSAGRRGSICSSARLPAIAEEVPDVRLVVAGDPIEPAEAVPGARSAARSRRADRVAPAVPRRR